MEVLKRLYFSLNQEVRTFITDLLNKNNLINERTSSYNNPFIVIPSSVIPPVYQQMLDATEAPGNTALKAEFNITLGRMLSTRGIFVAHASHASIHKMMPPMPHSKKEEMLTPLEVVQMIYQHGENPEYQSKEKLNIIQKLLAENGKLDPKAAQLIFTSRLHFFLIPEQLIDLYVAHHDTFVFKTFFEDIEPRATLPELFKRMDLLKVGQYLRNYPQLINVFKIQQEKRYPTHAEHDLFNDHYIQNKLHKNALGFIELRDKKINPYNELGIEHNATLDNIKIAYRKLMKIHHPDKAGEDPKVKEKAQLIIKCYELLIDCEARKFIDELLQHPEFQRKRSPSKA